MACTSTSTPLRGCSSRLLCLSVVLLSLAAGAAADVKVLSSKVLGEKPLWVQNRSADIVLDFSKADPTFKHPNLGTINFRGKDIRVRYHIGYYHGNVAMVRYGNQFIVAARKMHFYKTLREQIDNYPLSDKKDEQEISWWASKVAVCSVDANTLQPQSCEDYDPRDWKECLWHKGFEGEGVEDPRLIVWPGKGLYMMFGSKPWPVNPEGNSMADTKCAGPWAFQPWMVQLQSYGAQPDAKDPWQKGIVRLQYLPDGPQEPGVLLKEKNWNPFIYRGDLYFSQTFDPHVVIKAAPNGTCSKVYETSSRVFKELGAKPRGNTQAVLVPAAFSGEPRDFYLGVVHAETNRAYKNYFYKMQAHPPFRIYAVSQPMPIINSAHPRNPVWTSVSFPMSLDLLPETNQVMVGYGSGDKTPRVRMMPWEEVKALFPRNQEAMYTWRYAE